MRDTCHKKRAQASIHRYQRSTRNCTIGRLTKTNQYPASVSWVPAGVVVANQVLA
jgi:hypothetical protein